MSLLLDVVKELVDAANMRSAFKHDEGLHLQDRAACHEHLWPL